MSEADERFLDPSKAGKAALNEEGAEVEGHRHEGGSEDLPGKKGISDDMPGKKGLTEDDGPEVEGHVFRDKFGEPGKALKKG